MGCHRKLRGEVGRWGDSSLIYPALPEGGEKRPSLLGLLGEPQSWESFVFISKSKGTPAECLILTQSHKGTPGKPDTEEPQLWQPRGLGKLRSRSQF